MLPSKLQPGDGAPLFVLRDGKGNTVSLAERLKQKHVVLVFYRGYW